MTSVQLESWLVEQLSRQLKGPHARSIPSAAWKSTGWIRWRRSR